VRFRSLPAPALGNASFLMAIVTLFAWITRLRHGLPHMTRKDRFGARWSPDSAGGVRRCALRPGASRLRLPIKGSAPDNPAAVSQAIEWGRSPEAATHLLDRVVLFLSGLGHSQQRPEGRQNGAMEVLGSRILLHPSEPHRSHQFYRDILGLAIYRQFGSQADPGLVFFLGNGLLEVSGRSTDPPGNAIAIWIQVRDVDGEHRRLLQSGVPILREPRQEAWGLVEMWIADPEGVRIVLVEVPDDHPLRRDQRDLTTIDE
jgi:predicted enzyme related to lactoylglutathione lyase